MLKYFPLLFFFIFIFLLKMDCFAQSSLYYKDNPSGHIQSFLQTQIIDSIPYVIINDVRALSKFQRELISNNYKMVENKSKSIDLDTSNVIYKRGISLYYESWEGIKLYEIIGEKQAFKNIFDFWKGKKILIQRADIPGINEQYELTVNKLYFHSSRFWSFIIIECNPIDTDIFSMVNKNRWPNALIAYRYIYNWRSKFTDIKINSEIPLAVTNVFLTKVREFLPGNNENYKDYKRKSIIPLRFITKEQTEKIYYCGIISYGEKGCNGILYLFDESGNICQIIEGENYNKFIGLTDLNRDGSHELVLFYGSAFGGGIELLEFIEKSKDKPKLITRFRMPTVWD